MELFLASRWPYFFKLTFSAAPITEEGALSGEEINTSTAVITIDNDRQHRQKSSDDNDRNVSSSNEHRRRRHSSPSS